MKLRSMKPKTHLRCALFVPPTEKAPRPFDSDTWGPLDLIVFPEAFVDVTTSSEGLDWLVGYAKKTNAHVIAGATDGPWQVLYHAVPAGDISMVYVKHSTSKNVAFSLEEWSPETRLPILDINGVRVGVTICHDLYLGLLHQNLAQRGAQILVNPSFDSTNAMATKWRTIMRLRAVENLTPILCTMHDFGRQAKSAVPFGFAADGVELTSRGSDDDRAERPLSDAHDRLVHFVDVPVGNPTPRKLAVLPDSTKTVGTAYDGDSVELRLNNGEPQIRVGSRWRPATDATVDSGDRRALINVIHGEGLFDSAAFFAGLLKAERSGCRPVFWNIWEEIPARPSQLVDFLLGRALENCASVLISDRTSIYEVAEMASDTKSLRRRTINARSAVVNVERAWGLSSAFGIALKHVKMQHRDAAVERYTSLVGPAPRNDGGRRSR